MSCDTLSWTAYIMLCLMAGILALGWATLVYVWAHDGR